MHSINDSGTYNCICCGSVVYFDGNMEFPPPCPKCGKNLFVKSVFNRSKLTKVLFRSQPKIAFETAMK